MIEDDVKQMLAGRAEQAPVRTDGRDMLDRVRRRERGQVRRRAVAAAAAVAVLAGGGAWWSARTAPTSESAAAPPVATGSPNPERAPFTSAKQRMETWSGLRFAIPMSWKLEVQEIVFPRPPEMLTWGPFLGTLRTQPMCSTGENASCGRARGIAEGRPTAGVIAWIDAGRELPGLSRGHRPPMDDGPDTICPPGGTPFHWSGLLTGQDERWRVVLDGCAYGPRTKQYVRELRAVADSLRVVED